LVSQYQWTAVTCADSLHWASDLRFFRWSLFTSVGRLRLSCGLSADRSKITAKAPATQSQERLT